MAKRQPAKIAIAIASHDVCSINFTYDLANLAAFTVACMPDEVEFGVNLVAGTYVHAARQQLAVRLLEQGVTHILWIDSDMRFPRDALVRLLEHKLDAVGINYSHRHVPPGYVAIKEVGDDVKEGSKLATTDNSTGLEEVEGIGFGLFLIRSQSLANMPDPREHPWFWFEWLPTRRQMVGEDIYFCRLYREAGNRIFVDHDLSKECAHIGQFEYRTQMVETFRKEVEV